MKHEMMKKSVASATVHSGSRLVSNIARHPVLVFGLGIAAGYLVYRYRKEIISGTTRVVDASKDFVLQQKENLEDIIAETKEQ
jgi:hypothetical protein